MKGADIFNLLWDQHPFQALLNEEAQPRGSCLPRALEFGGVHTKKIKPPTKSPKKDSGDASKYSATVCCELQALIPTD